MATRTTLCEKCGKETSLYIESIYWNGKQLEIWECEGDCRDQDGERHRFHRRTGRRGGGCN